MYIFFCINEKWLKGLKYLYMFRGSSNKVVGNWIYFIMNLIVMISLVL